MSDLILKNIARCLGPDRKIHEQTSIWIRDGQIRFMGSWDILKKELAQSPAEAQVQDCDSLIAMPGLVESHTHLLFAGSREGELYLRAGGTPYLEILRQGGGIHNTVTAVRKASDDKLLNNGIRFLDMAMACGITTVEIKSGYGLDFKSEEKMLRLINRLNDTHPVDVIPTFLVHTVPRDTRRSRYIDEISSEWIPAFRSQAHWFDIFLEKGVFDIKETERLLKRAGEEGYHLGLHTNQVNDVGGIGLAQRLGVRHVDHLEVLKPEDARLILDDESMFAVFLPTAEGFVFSPHTGQIGQLMDMPRRLVLSSDFNPGSSPTLNPFFVMAYAVLRYRLSDPFLILDAWTRNPADMLYLDDRGILAPGKKADLILLDLERFEQIPYFGAMNFVRIVVKNGVLYPKTGSL